ncbi:MAG: DUF3109 family protein [Bacteroidota bacterium]
MNLLKNVDIAMIIIQDVLVSNDVVEQQFHCNLNACKGACCWEGDFGAPVEPEEKATLEAIYPIIKDRLPAESREIIEREGVAVPYKGLDKEGTPLRKNGACVYLTEGERGIARCSIEQACEAGDISFKKPISCHLYPIRVKTEEGLSFTALNYDQWDICSAACQLGKEKQLPVYQFVKAALIRRFGVDFYEELDAAAQHLHQSE